MSSYFVLPEGTKIHMSLGPLDPSEIPQEDRRILSDPLDLGTSDEKIDEQLQSLRDRTSMFRVKGSCWDAICGRTQDEREHALQRSRTFRKFKAEGTEKEEGSLYDNAIKFWDNKAEETRKSFYEVEHARDVNATQLAHSEAAVKLAEAMRSIFMVKRSRGQITSSDAPNGLQLVESDEADFRAALSKARMNNDETCSPWMVKAKKHRSSGSGYEVVPLAEWPSKFPSLGDDTAWLEVTKRMDNEYFLPPYASDDALQVTQKSHPITLPPSSVLSNVSK